MGGRLKQANHGRRLRFRPYTLSTDRGSFRSTKCAEKPNQDESRIIFQIRLARHSGTCSKNSMLLREFLETISRILAKSPVSKWVEPIRKLPPLRE